MTKTPEDILKEWMQCVNEADAENLLAMYHENAVLIPTFSNRLLTKPESIRDYFEKLASREDLSIALHEKTVSIQPVHGDVYCMCGIYCWRFSIDGQMLSFEARFSYTLDLSNPRPIIHHHSSQIPRML